MQLAIPDDLGLTQDEAHLAVAVGLYGTRAISLARAARLAGRSRLQFQRLLAASSIPMAYDRADLADDSALLTRMERELAHELERE
jgi:predicted HTH domain antitoxin